MRTEIVWLILGISAASLLPRILPVAWLSRCKFSPKVQEWLSLVPAAVLSSLLAVSVLAPSGKLEISTDNVYIWAIIPTFIIALWKKSLFLTLGTGIVIMALLYRWVGA